MSAAAPAAAGWIALLRAINVGGHTVKMDRLRQLFAELGFTAVETFIASGNVRFSGPAGAAAALEAQIAAHLERSLGYAVATFLRSPDELRAVAAYQPFAAAELAAPGHSLYVGFLHAPAAEAAQARLLALRGPAADFHICGREAYWLSRGLISQSPLSNAGFEKALGVPVTLRNITTVRKLAAKQ
jgi:uncharacterized protein (DUF1697 family)